ncbi:MAG: hypothetical protein LC808_15445, partial [Actinobacteria bacterium]|nr:hypothetical protein [Actinomycetota bacterium]
RGRVGVVRSSPQHGGECAMEGTAQQWCLGGCTPRRRTSGGGVIGRAPWLVLSWTAAGSFRALRAVTDAGSTDRRILLTLLAGRRPTVRQLTDHAAGLLQH